MATNWKALFDPTNTMSYIGCREPYGCFTDEEKKDAGSWASCALPVVDKKLAAKFHKGDFKYRELSKRDHALDEFGCAFADAVERDEVAIAKMIFDGMMLLARSKRKSRKGKK